MRALCGAIITAGALVGVGLTGMGFGMRYSGVPNVENVHGGTAGLIWAMVFTTAVACIGMGIAFLGLMYHHHRRYHEFLREYGSGGAHVAPRP